jgi:phosphate transport system permease protein
MSIPANDIPAVRGPAAADPGDSQAVRGLIAAHKRWDHVVALAALSAMLFCVLVLLALILAMMVDGYQRLTLDFFTHFPSRHPDRAGILSAWVGSILVITITVLSAVPVGVAAGIYLEIYAKRNWLMDLIEVNITNLAAVPSIIYGLLALGLFVHIMGLGKSILTAGLTMALMILPMIIMNTREAIRAIPKDIHEAAYALGATKGQATRDHLLPYSRGGILTGVIIGTATAIGETAPLITIGALTFIAFLPPAPVTDVAPFISLAWLLDPFTTVPIQMYNWISRPQPAFHELAAAAGVVLMLITLGMNALAIWLRYRYRKRIRW